MGAGMGGGRAADRLGLSPRERLPEILLAGGPDAGYAAIGYRLRPTHGAAACQSHVTERVDWPALPPSSTPYVTLSEQQHAHEQNGRREQRTRGPSFSRRARALPSKLRASKRLWTAYAALMASL